MCESSAVDLEGVCGDRADGHRAEARAEKFHLSKAIKKSIARRLATPNAFVTGTPERSVGGS